MPIWDKLFGSGAKGLVDSVGNALDGLITNKEELAAAKLAVEKETNRHIEAMGANVTKELELQLQDVANSRDANVKIQESENSSWLSKNTGYCLDIFISMIWSGLTFYIAAKYLNIIKLNAGVDFSGVWGLYASVTGLMTIVLSWHRGSSRGSAEKAATIEKMKTPK